MTYARPTGLLLQMEFNSPMYEYMQTTYKATTQSLINFLLTKTYWKPSRLVPTLQPNPSYRKESPAYGTLTSMVNSDHVYTYHDSLFAYMVNSFIKGEGGIGWRWLPMARGVRINS